MLTHTLNGIPHWIEWIREDPSVSKPVMVFVHGWGGSGRYWRPIAEIMSKEYDCLLYDLRGFGRTAKLVAPERPPQHADPRDPVYSMGSYAQDLHTLMADLDLREVTLMAHSMGASVATLMAGLRDPDGRVQRLVLTCSGIFAYNALTFGLFHRAGSVITRIRPQWLTRIPGMGKVFAARFLHRSIPAGQRREILEDYIMADPVAVEGTLYTAVSLQASQEMPEAFGALGIPTLLIAGEQDQIIPPKLAERAVATNPAHICYVEMPGVGHFPMLEDPEGYLQVLQAFLQQKNGDPLGV